MATSKNGSTYPKTGGHNIKVADILLARFKANEGATPQSIMAGVGRVDFDLKGSTTSQDTYSRAAKMLGGMDTTDVLNYLSEEVTAGSYYKRRACVKQAITLAASRANHAEVGKLVIAFNAHTKPKMARRVSRQASNRGLKQDWREVFIGRLAASKSKHKAAALVCYLTGARPHEYTPDLGVTVFKNGDELVIEIKGAKVKEDSAGKVLTGMPKRRFKFKMSDDDTDPALRLLASLMPVDAFKLEIKFDAAKKVNTQKSRLNELIGRCGEGLTNGNFSAYNLRHNFSSSLKAAGVTSEQISQALGHSSLKTKQYYGHPRGGSSGGGNIPVEVTSSHLPRAPVVAVVGTTAVVSTEPLAAVAAAPTPAAVVAPVVAAPVVKKRGFKM